MTKRIYTGCRDCKKCTNSVVANFGRNTGRVTAGLMTAGASELGMASMKKCRICGHQLSLHHGAEAVTVQPAYAPVQSPRPAPNPMPDQPSSPRGMLEQHDTGKRESFWKAPSLGAYLAGRKYPKDK